MTLRSVQRRWYATHRIEVRSKKNAQTRSRIAKAIEKNPDYWRDLYAENRESMKANALRSYHRKSAEKKRDEHLRARYGLSRHEWERMFDAQGRNCAICGTGDARRWVTDHCHTTGAVRGILCDHCNVALGRIKESSAIGRSLVEYIDRRCDPLKAHRCAG
jgi:hypothetical protein